MAITLCTTAEVLGTTSAVSSSHSPRIRCQSYQRPCNLATPNSLASRSMGLTVRRGPMRLASLFPASPTPTLPSLHTVHLLLPSVSCQIAALCPTSLLLLLAPLYHLELPPLLLLLMTTLNPLDHSSPSPRPKWVENYSDSILPVLRAKMA